MLKRCVTSVFVAFTCLAVLVAVAQDRGEKDTGTKDSRTGTKDSGGRTGSGMDTFTGQIERVDADKRTIQLKNARMGSAGTGGIGTKDAGIRTKDSGTGTKDTGSGTKDSGTGTKDAA